MNVIHLKGRLGHDPSHKQIDAENETTELSVATSYKYKDKEFTTWHKCIAWGPQAKTLKQYFSKGDEIIIEGRQENRKWEDKEGNKRISSEVRINRFHFVGSKQSGEAKDAKSTGAVSPTEGLPNMAPQFDDKEEVPF